MYKCGNCNKSFEVLALINGIANCCPICGDNRYLSGEEEIKVVIKKEPNLPPNLDFNNDGNVDKKDLSIAGRFLRSNRRKR